MGSLRHARRLAPLCLVLPVLAGCASMRLPAEQLGPIGVVPGRGVHEVRYTAPAGSRQGGAALGAGEGLARGVEASAGAGPFGLILAPLLAPGFALIGAVEGVARTPTAGVDVADAAIQRALAEIHLAPALVERVVALAARRASRPPIPLTRPDRPASAGGPEYRWAVESGVQTVLELTATSVSLWRQSCGHQLYCPDPPYRLLVTVRARLLRAQDGLELYAEDFHHSAGEGRFAAWGASDAAWVRSALSGAPDAVAPRIVEALGRAGTFGR